MIFHDYPLNLKPFFLSHASSQSHLFGQLHPLHSCQMLALPIIPPTVSSPFADMKDYFEQTGKWCICQIGSEDLVINSSTNFISLVPYAATFPFEIWIVPSYHFEHFHELDAEKAVDFGGLLKLISSFLKGESKTRDFLIFMKVEMFYICRMHFKKPFVRLRES